MKIQIFCGHFIPTSGYQEVYLARTYSRLGYKVQVVTTTHVPKSYKPLVKEKYYIGKQLHESYEIIRLKGLLRMGSMVWSKNLRKLLVDFNPKYVIIIGVGKIFPVSLFCKGISDKYFLISLFGDNADFFLTHTLKSKINSYKQNILRKLVKSYIYKLAIKYSGKIIYYTPQTKDIIQKTVSKGFIERYSNKFYQSTLGFDPAIYFFSSELRAQYRNLLSLKEEDILISTATRVIPQKRLELFIDAMSKLIQKKINVHYAIIGLQNDSYSTELRDYVSKLSYKDNIHLINIKKEVEINGFYCASDFGIWPNASISIQNAMGTGLPIIAEDKKTINYLISESENGITYPIGELDNFFSQELDSLLDDFSHHPLSDRIKIIDFNTERYSYNKIAEYIINNG